MIDAEFGSLKFLKLNNRCVSKSFNYSAELVPHKKLGIEFEVISKKWEKDSCIMENALKSSEWCKIWVFQIAKIEIKTGRPNNLAVL